MHTTRLAQLLRWLPGPLLAGLDGWSHRLAQRRARQRLERWQRRQAAAAR